MEKGLLGEPVVVGQGEMALDWTKVDLDWVSGWNFFMMVVRQQNRFPREVVDVSIMEDFKVV